MHSLPNRAVGDRATPSLSVRRLGLRAYADACALQEASARRVAAGGPDELLFARHPPVITLGRGATPEQLLASRRELARRGISVVSTDRGGGATYHGTGQIVGYPIVALRRRGLSVSSYLRALEETLVAVLRDAGLEVFTRVGLTGVWSASGKVAAIGIAVRGGITRHGFALNEATDLAPFRCIIPCGLREPVTSMEALGWTGAAAVLLDDIGSALSTALSARRPKRAPTSLRRLLERRDRNPAPASSGPALGLAPAPPEAAPSGAGP